MAPNPYAEELFFERLGFEKTGPGYYHPNLAGLYIESGTVNGINSLIEAVFKRGLECGRGERSQEIKSFLDSINR